MKPWQSHQEMLVDIALESAISTPEQIRNIRPIVAPNLFPNSRGMLKQEPDLMSILHLSRDDINARSWVSGAAIMFRTGQMVDNSFSGTLRNSMST